MSTNAPNTSVNSEHELSGYCESAPKRQKLNQEKETEENTDSDNDDSHSGTRTSTSHRYSTDEQSRPNYRVCRRWIKNMNLDFKLLYSTTDEKIPRAVLRLKDNQMFVVKQVAVPPLLLPEGMTQGIRMDMITQLNSLLEELFKNIHEDRNIDGHWCAPNTANADMDQDDDFFVSNSYSSQILAKYSLLTEDVIDSAVEFRRTFLTSPALDHSEGRLGVTRFLEIIRSCLPIPLAYKIRVCNAGGSTRTTACLGSSTIGRRIDRKPYSGTQMKEEMLKDVKDTSRHTPDFLFAKKMSKKPWRSVCLVGEVKSGSEYKGVATTASVTKCERQAWEQGLAGLKYSDTSYYLMVSPHQADYGKITIQKPVEGSTTTTTTEEFPVIRTLCKVYPFTKQMQNDVIFNIDGLKCLVKDMANEMYRFAMEASHSEDEET